MNLENRRLKDIRNEKRFWREQLRQSKSQSDKLAFKGKIDILNKEEKQILRRLNIYD